jgi:tetratricopeptide (TPR) repeat protein
MSQERDHLVKFVFPELRKLCDLRRVVWGEVDLRWGITDEQAAEGKILPICLEEIRRCRPYFIGLLGERYGSVPKQIPADLLETQPWLRAETACSVTELEILHGVLRDPQMNGPAFFYFRDPTYLNRLSAGLNRSDFDSDGPEATQKLLRLKQRIRQASDRRICRLRENYRDPVQLGEWILQDFSELIEILFPVEQRPDPVVQEAADHEAFAESRQRVYVGRQEYFDRLDAHAGSNDSPLVIVGESGAGKSALLANWAARYSVAHPQEPVFMHFVGATRQSTDWAAMLHRLMSAWKSAFAIGAEVPSDPAQLRAVFGNWLHMASSSARFVMIVDGLNQLEDRDGALDLAWLPPEVPANTRIFLSTLPGRALDELNRRGWPKMEVKRLEAHERRKLISEYLAQYTKSLSQAHAERISAAPQTANPLYLCGVLEELRLFGEHEQLDDYIANYLEAKSPSELYQKILARWEADYGAGISLVSEAMSLLWAARRGLSESELLTILGTSDGPLPGAHWSPLYLAAEHALVNRSGLLNFGHPYLREAVRLRYLPAEEEKNARHLRLADYFQTQPVSPRQVDELPWQLIEAQSWDRLCRLFLYKESQTPIPQFLPAAWDQSQYDVQTHWARVETAMGFGADYLYHVQPDIPDADYLDVLALLLDSTGRLKEATNIREVLVRHYDRIGGLSGLETSLGSLADSLIHQGKLASARDALQRQEEICSRLGDDYGLQRCLGMQGVVQMEMGRLQEAETLYKRQEKICRSRNDLRGIGISINNQAMIAYEQRDFDRALALYREEERICRQLGDLDGLQASFGGQANALKKQGHLADVMDLYRQQERICRQLGDKIGVIISVGNQASLLRHLHNFPGAMKKHRDEEALCRETGYLKGLAISLGNQAHTLQDMEKADEALEKLQEQEKICRKIDNRPILQGCLNNQANLYLKREDYERVWPLWQEREAILRELGPPIELAVLLGAKASLLKKVGRPIGEVRTALVDQERVCRDLGNPAWLAQAKLNQAMHLPEPESSRALGEARRLVHEHYLPEVEEMIAEVQAKIRKN